MNRYREHWNPNHPAVMAWLDQHPDGRDSLAYRKAMVRQRRGLNHPRNHDRLRAMTGIALLIGSAVTAGHVISFVIVGIAGLVLYPFLKNGAQG
jgi:hypothetical protein